MTESPTASEPRRATLAFIFVTVMLDMLALGMIIPVIPELIKSFRGGDTAAAAATLGTFGTAWALMQFFASPILGALSDHFGRRKIILLSNFGLGVDYIFMAVSPTLAWLFVGRLVSGITAASIPTAFAYIADVTPAEKRAKAFGILGAAFGTGFVVGPVIGGVLGHYGPRLPFWVAAGFSLTNAMYGLFVLPESLSPDHRAPFSWKRANPVGALSLLARHQELLGFAAIHFLYFLAHQSLQNVFVLYADYRYGWNTRDVGLCLGAVGISFMIVQGGLVGRAVAKFGERRMMLTGLTAGAIGFLIYGAATTGTWFMAGVPIIAFLGLYGPSAQGLMTRRVGESEQGRLQGALTSVASLTGIVGPGLFTFTFAKFIGSQRSWHLPGAPFLLASSLLVIALGIAWRVTRVEASQL